MTGVITPRGHVHGNLRKRAYQHIRRKLLSGECAPGARLSNRGVAAEIGISFIPVREAISQLVAEGLVDHRPGLGFFVSMPSREDIENLYDLREALECHAAVRTIGRISAADLDRMDRYNEVLRAMAIGMEDGAKVWSAVTADRCLQADASLHLTLLEAAGNPRTVQLVTDVRIIAHLFTADLQYREPVEDLTNTYDEHARMIAAVRAGDADAARREIAGHIRASCRSALAAFGEQDDRT